MKTFVEKLRENRPASLALLALPLALLIAGVSSFRAADKAERHNRRAAVVQRTDSPRWEQFEGREGPPPREERRERRRGGRHHGPPPVPSTVLFLVGAGLGYLIGRGRHGRCGPSRHHFRPDYYPPGHPAHQPPTVPNS